MRGEYLALVPAKGLDVLMQPFQGSQQVVLCEVEVSLVEYYDVSMLPS